MLYCKELHCTIDAVTSCTVGKCTVHSCIYLLSCTVLKGLGYTVMYNSCCTQLYCPEGNVQFFQVSAITMYCGVLCMHFSYVQYCTEGNIQFKHSQLYSTEGKAQFKQYFVLEMMHSTQLSCTVQCKQS